MKKTNKSIKKVMKRETKKDIVPHADKMKFTQSRLCIIGSDNQLAQGKCCMYFETTVKLALLK